MNAISKVAPELTAEKLIAVVKVLPPAAAVPEPARTALYVSLRACEDHLDPEGDNELSFRWAYSAFGDPDGSADDDGLDLEYERWDAWRDTAGRHSQTSKPWNYLLDEAERLAPDFSRWGLPGARLSVVDGPAAAPLQIVSFDDDDDEPQTPPWPIANLWQERSLGVVVGPPAGCKTTMVLTAALHIAAGRPFAGRDVLQGAVVYVAAEGHVGALKVRVRAMRAEYRMEGALPFHLVDRAVNLLKPAEVDSLLASIAGTSGPVRAVIFDTLPRCMVGGDENSAQVMGQVIASLERVRDASNAAVIALTHPARGGLEARGSSALEGAIDTRINVSATREGTTVKTVTLKVSKQKNGPDGDSILFDMKLGTAALVPIHRDVAPVTPTAPAAPKANLSAKAKLALAFLVKHGAATEDAWRVAVAGQLTSSSEGKAQRQAFYRVRDELRAAGAVVLGDDGQWRAAV